MCFQLGGGRMEEVEGKNHAPLPRRKLIDYLYHLMFHPFFFSFAVEALISALWTPYCGYILLGISGWVNVGNFGNDKCCIVFIDMNVSTK